MDNFQKTCKKLVLYLVSAVSADGLGHPHVLRWPEGIDTLWINTHVKKMQLHRQNDYQTDRMGQLRRWNIGVIL